MNIAKMLKQAQQMQAKLAETQAELAEKTFEASVGGGKVKVVGETKGRDSSQKRHGDGAVSLLLAEAATGTKAESGATSPMERWGVRTGKRRKS